MLFNDNLTKRAEPPGKKFPARLNRTGESLWVAEIQNPDAAPGRFSLTAAAQGQGTEGKDRQPGGGRFRNRIGGQREIVDIVGG